MIFLRIFFIVFVFTNTSFADETDDLLQGISSEINKTMGGMSIDPITKLQNTLYRNLGKREFVYVYVITDDSVSSNSPGWTTIKNKATRSFCTDPEMKIFLDYTTVTMKYQKLNGMFLHKFNFSKNDCNESSYKSKKMDSDLDNRVNSTKSKVINIDDKRITVPSPYGFYIENDKEVLDLFKLIFPKDVITIQAIIFPEKYDDNFSRYIMIASMVEFEKQVLSDRKFKELSKFLVKQQYTLLNKVKGDIDKVLETGIKNFKDKYDMDVSGSIDETTSLGLFINKDNALSLAVIMEGQFSFDGDVDSTPMIATISYLNLKNRFVVAYVYNEYKDNKNLVWVKSKTRELVDLLLQANNGN